MGRMATIPLIRPDLTQGDREAVACQLPRSPFRDDHLVRRWEATWSQLWNRTAVLFDDPVDVIVALKSALAWPDGARIAVGTDLHSAWREGFAAAWLRVVYHDVDPTQTPAFPDDGRFSGVLVGHFQGLPVLPPNGPGVVLEDLSSMPLPLPGTGCGDVQLMVMDGNAMIQGGNAALVLCRDGQIAARLMAKRRPPSALMAALGLSQLQQIKTLLARRDLLASRYLCMRPGGLFDLPTVPDTPRWWHGFHLSFKQKSRREGLRHFLHKAHIRTGPAWHFSFPEVENMTWRQRLDSHTLALPLYASLNDTDQKRVINRIHRWVSRGGPTSPQ